MVAISIQAACGATWEDSFEGKFARNYYVEPQAKGQGWNHRRINPARGFSGAAGEVSIVAKPAREGGGAMKCVSKDGKRMELELVNRDERHSPGVNQHCWAAVSILIPDSDAPKGGFCVQWHGGVPNAAQGKEYARGPEAAVRISGGNLVYWNNFKASKSAEGGRRRCVLVEKPKPGQWYDLVFHHYFSLKEDGLTEIWVDAKKVYAEKGCNCFYYRSKFAFKFGLYGSGSRGTIYFDEAKVITGPASYEKVAPKSRKDTGGKTPATSNRPNLTGRLLLASRFIKQGDKKRAAVILKAIIKKYPGAPEAGQARNMLKELQ